MVIINPNTSGILVAVDANKKPSPQLLRQYDELCAAYTRAGDLLLRLGDFERVKLVSQKFVLIFTSCILS